MTDRPIIFSGPMIRALLAGRKTQTRRVLGNSGRCNIFKAGVWSDSYVLDPGNADWRARDTPYAVGDRLYVREAHLIRRAEPCQPHERDWQSLMGPVVRYLADGHEIRHQGDRSTGRGIYHGPVEKGRPSIHMPRWASRITLLIDDVRVQRLRDMEGQHHAESDAIAEGVNAIHHGDGDYYYSAFRDEPHPQNCSDPTDAFRELWNSLHGSSAWEQNPWVVALTFRVHLGNIDQLAA